jgi:hypothetical protein
MRSTAFITLLSTNAPFLTERAMLSPFRNADFGLRIQEHCNCLFNPHSAIRNPQSI